MQAVITETVSTNSTLHAVVRLWGLSSSVSGHRTQYKNRALASEAHSPVSWDRVKKKLSTCQTGQQGWSNWDLCYCGPIDWLLSQPLSPHVHNPWVSEHLSGVAILKTSRKKSHQAEEPQPTLPILLCPQMALRGSQGGPGRRELRYWPCQAQPYSDQASPTDTGWTAPGETGLGITPWLALSVFGNEITFHKSSFSSADSPGSALGMNGESDHIEKEGEASLTETCYRAHPLLIPQDAQASPGTSVT
jgi:hypothetical protein